ncbi:MAG: nucleotidyltransferase domain-containing protein [Acidobacteriota bacterium]|jgi:predicted nucleotidyltransferase
MSADRRLLDSIRSVLERHPEVRLALLFGSRARGADGPEADLDLAVELFRGEELDRLGLMAELRAATGLETDVVDVTPGRCLGYPLLNALNRDGIAVHAAERHAEAEFRTRALLQLSLDRTWYERMRNAYLDRLAAETEEAADG